MPGTTTIRIDETSIELPEVNEAGRGGGFAFGVYKGGSTLLFKALRRILGSSNISYVDFVHLFDSKGILLERAKFGEENEKLLETWFRRKGTVFGGWREFPVNYKLPLLSDTATYLLVRDPRDCITSHYYSLKYSHTLSGASGSLVSDVRKKMQNIGIDEFALSQGPALVRRFSAYDSLRASNLMLRRYEDVVFNKFKLLSDVCRHFGIDAPLAKIKHIAREVDKRPPSEDVNEHVRQVAPGDHKKKLKAATIESLNQVLSDVLSKYGYE